MWLILFGRIAQFLLMLATLRVATSCLTPAEMGKIAIITTSIAFVSSFLINPVGMYVNRQLHRWHSEGCVNKFIGYQYGYVFIIALISSVVIGLLSAFGLLDMHLPKHFVMVFVFFSLFFNTINQTAIPSLNLLGFRGWFTLLSIATVLLGLVFAILFVKNFKAQSEYWLSGLLVGQILLAIVGALVFYKKANHHPRVVSVAKPHPKVVFQFAWPIAVAIGLTWFQSQSYRFFIEDSFGLSSLGLFVAGYGISAGIMAGFESVFVTYFQPFFYEAVSVSTEDNRVKAWNQYALAIIPSVLLLAFTLSALSIKLTELMLAPSFRTASIFVIWGAFTEAFRVLSNVYNMVAHAEQDTKMLILPNFIGAFVCLMLIHFLMPHFGILGIASALLISGFTVVAFLHIRMKQKLSIRVPYYEISRAILFGLLICCMSYVSEPLLQENITVVFFQFGVVGLLFMMAEYYLLKIRGAILWT